MDRFKEPIFHEKTCNTCYGEGTLDYMIDCDGEDIWKPCPSCSGLKKVEVII